MYEAPSRWIVSHIAYVFDIALTSCDEVLSLAARINVPVRGTLVQRHEREVDVFYLWDTCEYQVRTTCSTSPRAAKSIVTWTFLQLDRALI